MLLCNNADKVSKKPDHLCTAAVAKTANTNCIMVCICNTHCDYKMLVIVTGRNTTHTSRDTVINKYVCLCSTVASCILLCFYSVLWHFSYLTHDFVCIMNNWRNINLFLNVLLCLCNEFKLQGKVFWDMILHSLVLPLTSDIDTVCCKTVRSYELKFSDRLC